MKIEKILNIALVTAILMIITSVALLIVDMINEYNCETLTPYEFYNNDYCVKHWSDVYEKKKENQN